MHASKGRASSAVYDAPILPAVDEPSSMALEAGGCEGRKGIKGAAWSLELQQQSTPTHSPSPQPTQPSQSTCRSRELVLVSVASIQQQKPCADLDVAAGGAATGKATTGADARPQGNQVCLPLCLLSAAY